MPLFSILTHFITFVDTANLKSQLLIKQFPAAPHNSGDELYVLKIVDQLQYQNSQVTVSLMYKSPQLSSGECITVCTGTYTSIMI